MTELDVLEPPTELPAAAPPTIRGRAARLARWVGWAAVVLAAVAYAFAYLLPQDFRRVNTPYLLLAALAFFLRVFQFHAALTMGAVAVLAVAARRWRLAGAATLVGVALFLPTLSFRAADRPAAGPTVRVMSANLYFRNRDGWRIIEEVRRADPDVLVVVEFTPLHAVELAAAFGADYPYRDLRPAMTSGGIGVYSRLPLRPDPAMSNDWMLRSLLTVAGKRIVLDAVHLTSPGSLDAIRSNRLLTAELVDRYRAEARPVIVAGDFNFDDTTPNFAALRRVGLTATQSLAGEGRGATWPNRTPLRHLPGVRIDHVLVRSGTGATLGATRAWVGGNTGSDHLPIVADVGVR